MAFDPCSHNLTQMVIKAGRYIRGLRGLPPEKNITVLYMETATLLGIPVNRPTSREARRLPSSEYRGSKEDGFVSPSKPCPQCGKPALLLSICPSCKESEGGKFKSGYVCNKNTGGCGLIDEKTEEWITKRLKRMGIEFPTGMKQDIGIGTITNDGVR